MISQVSSFFFISILLLAEGRTAYMGSRADVIQYFEGSVFLKNKEMSLKRCIFIIDSFCYRCTGFHDDREAITWRFFFLEQCWWTILFSPLFKDWPYWFLYRWHTHTLTHTMRTLLRAKTFQVGWYSWILTRHYREKNFYFWFIWYCLV